MLRRSEKKSRFVATEDAGCLGAVTIDGIGVIRNLAYDAVAHFARFGGRQR